MSRLSVALRALLLVLVLACVAMPGRAPAQAAVDPAPLAFADAREEARFHALVARLRCVMCQNQSLADSNAQIAHDLRREVLGLMREGRDDAAIETFLVERYGEFVLYRPRLGTHTWLLWFGPLLLLAGGAGVIVAVVRRRGREAGPPAGEDAREW